MQLSGRSDVVAVYKRLFAYMRPHWAIMALAIVPASVYAILNTSVPLVMKEVIARLETRSQSRGARVGDPGPDCGGVPAARASWTFSRSTGSHGSGAR